MRELRLANRCRPRRVNLPFLRRLAQALLEDELGVLDYVLHVHLVTAAEITVLNETYLRHAGPTDVITFDYAADSRLAALHSDLFLCLDEAERLGRRFRSTWQVEVTRYLIHGLLHLRGYADGRRGWRKVMKRAEDRLLRRLARRFTLSRLALGPKVTK
jgi:probable rRNA maturation factor